VAGHYEVKIERYEQTHDSATVPSSTLAIVSSRKIVTRPVFAQVALHCKTICLTIVSVTDTITIRTDDETEHALDVLTHDGSSRSAAIRQAVLEAARRRERAAEMRRAVLRMDLGQPDGVNIAEELARDRASEP
jgi:hypothetical protein